MKNFFIPLFVLTLLFSSCVSKPTVTRYQTVSEFNAYEEVADRIVEKNGYVPFGYRAKTVYKYVLFDDHKQCREGTFCTESSTTEIIFRNSRCLKCGKQWWEHKDF